MLSPTVYDTFNRTVSGGLGTALSGNSWTSTVGADSSVTPATTNTPGLALHTCGSTGIRISVVGPNVTDSDVRFGFAASALTTGALASAGSVARYTNSSNHYYFRIDFNTDQQLGYQIRKMVAGVDTLIGAGVVAGLKQVVGGRYWARAKLTGTSLQLKVWSDATGEPFTWTATTSDSAISAAGQVGVRSEKPSGNTNASIVLSYSYFTCGPYADATGKALAYNLEAAWGADLAADAATWLWTDITSDVYLPDANAPAINARVGRSDWAGQAEPASLAAALTDIAAKYAAYNPASPNYPNVVRNTPIRLRIGYSIVRFFGFANGWPPTWDLVTTDPVVGLTASGILRRLGQGSIPLRSPLTQSILGTKSPTLRQYWPCEDAISSTQAASAITGNAALTATAATNFAAFAPTNVSGVAALRWPYGTANLPNLRDGGQLSATFPVGSATGWTVQIGAFVDPFSTPTAVVIAEWATPGGTYVRWQLVSDSQIATNGTRVIGYDAVGIAATLASSSFASGSFTDYRIQASQVGGNISLVLKFPLDTVSATLTTKTLAGVTGMTLNPTNQVVAFDFAAGQVRIWDGITAPDFQVSNSLVTTGTNAAWFSYVGEPATDRMIRLCAEQGVPFALTGTSTIPMGPQTVDTLLNLLRQCEAADLGDLADGQGAGLTYINRAQRYNQAAAMTLDASIEQVSPPFRPMDDDQRIRNAWLVNRTSGSSMPYSDDDPTHALSTKRIGTYQDSTTINLATDATLLNQAAWRVHLGTVEGFRYPTMSADLFRNPEVGGVWLDVDLAGRLDVTNLPPPHPFGTVSLAVEGYTEAVGDFAWDVVANCSPYDPWNVTALDVNFRLELAGQTLTSTATVGATSLSLTTAAGKPLFSTGAAFPADFPMFLNIGGWQIRVTAATGSSSPQTLTVDPIPATLPGGTAVTLWKPAALAL